MGGASYWFLSAGLGGTALWSGSNSSSCWMIDLALTWTPEILMLIPRRFPGPLAGTMLCVMFGREQNILKKMFQCRQQTFNWVLLQLLLVLLYRRHTAGVNQLTEPLQVCYGFVHQLRVSSNGLQPGRNMFVQISQKQSNAMKTCRKEQHTNLSRGDPNFL